MSTDSYTPDAFTTVRRHDRAHYERDAVHAILDEAPVAHVGFVDRGRPVVIPMLHARIDDAVYVHGAHPSRIARSLPGSVVCITATILDGWVLARSAFHHSANYRSAVAYGTARVVDDLGERRSVLDALMEKISPGRAPHLRPTTDKELRGTAVIGIPIESASAKVRTGPPIDDPEDVDLPIWAGIIPTGTTYGSPVAAPDLHADATVPEHLGFFST